MRGSGIAFGAALALFGVAACKRAYDKGRNDGIDERSRIVRTAVDAQEAVKKEEEKES